MDFNNIKIEQLVKYINLELNKNNKLSVNKVCDLIGIKKGTLKSRMARGGYSYNIDNRRYELTNKITPLEPTKQAIEEIKEVAIIDKVVEEVKSNTEPFKGVTDMGKLNLLLDNLDSVLELINRNKITCNVDTESTYRSGRNDVKSLRVDMGLYGEVKQRATTDNTTIADIINKAIEDYLNNYL